MDYRERSGFTIEREEQRCMREQAMYWVDALDGSRLDFNRAEFFTWLKESPQHVEELLMAVAINDALFDFDYEKYGFSLQSGGANSVVEFPQSFAPPIRADRPHDKRRRFRVLAVIAAALLFAITGIVLQSAFSPKAARYQTAIGEIKRITLSDGSRIVLNTDSAITVRLSRGARLIDLRRGEADFTVASDSHRPFIATSGETRVHALGTRFSIRFTSARRTEVLVSSGHVAIHRANDNVQLAKLSGNERIVVLGGQIAAREYLPPERMTNAALWLQGRLSFAGETIAEAAAEFNRYNKRRLLVADEAAGRQQFIGSFNPTDLDDFVELLRELDVAPIAATPDVIVLGSIHANGRADRKKPGHGSE